MSVEKWKSYIGSLRRMEEEALTQIRKFDKDIRDARSDSAEVARFKSSKTSWEEHLNKIREKIRSGENSIEQYNAQKKDSQGVRSEKRRGSEFTEQQEPSEKMIKCDNTNSNNNNNVEDNVFDDEPSSPSSTSTTQQQHPISNSNDTPSSSTAKDETTETKANGENALVADCNDINSCINYAISWLSFIESNARADNSNLRDIETLKDVNIFTTLKK